MSASATQGGHNNHGYSSQSWQVSAISGFNRGLETG